MIRDGRDCAASFHRRWGYHPMRSMVNWSDMVSEGRRQGLTVEGKYLEVRYEDITQDPEQSIRRICEFLSISYEQKMLESSPRPRKQQPKRMQRISRNKVSYMDYLPSHTLEKMERIGGATLSAMGYPAKYPESSDRPHSIRLGIWELGDKTRATFRIFFRGLATGRSEAIKMALRRIKSSARSNG